MFKFCSNAYNLSASAVKLQKLYSRQRQKMCDLCSHVSMLTLPYKNACNCRATKDTVKLSTAVALFWFSHSVSISSRIEIYFCAICLCVMDPLTFPKVWCWFGNGIICDNHIASAPLSDSTQHRFNGKNYSLLLYRCSYSNRKRYVNLRYCIIAVVLFILSLYMCLILGRFWYSSRVHSCIVQEKLKSREGTLSFCCIRKRVFRF